MNDASAKGKGREQGRLARRARRGGKWVLGIVAVLAVAHVAWVDSGSSRWKLVSDTDGVRVSSMKTPGYSLLKYKVEMHLDSKLSDIVYYMSDLNTGYDVGASDIHRLEQVTADPMFYAYDTYKLDLKPFGKLDVMIVNEYVQDPVTKKVNINVYAAPNKRAADPGIPRVVHLSDNFTLTPLASGGVDLQLLSEMDLGLPYIVQNLVMPGVAHDESAKMRAMLKKDKYRNGRPAFITELHDDRKLARN
jgi:hypothetical protein